MEEDDDGKGDGRCGGGGSVEAEPEVAGRVDDDVRAFEVFVRFG